MTAVSRRAPKLLPWQARRNAEISPLVNTGTSRGFAVGARNPATGSGRSSSRASQRRNRRTARNWLLAYAVLYSPSSRTVHRCRSCRSACSYLVLSVSQSRCPTANQRTACV
jgi:hypothetical protein